MILFKWMNMNFFKLERHCWTNPTQFRGTNLRSNPERVSSSFIKGWWFPFRKFTYFKFWTLRYIKKNQLLRSTPIIFFFWGGEFFFSLIWGWLLRVITTWRSLWNFRFLDHGLSDWSSYLHIRIDVKDNSIPTLPTTRGWQWQSAYVEAPKPHRFYCNVCSSFSLYHQ